MAKAQTPPKTLFAPAKINLFLHITGKRNDGYHMLESLVSFANIGDYVTLSPSKAPGLEISGPFASNLSDKEHDSGPDSQNILMKALWGLSRIYRRAPEFHVRLQKNLPLAAGIGGGSSDAAALIWGVVQEWGPPEDHDILQEFMLSLGADVPVCYSCDNAFVTGIGDQITPLNDIAEMPIVLINPLKPCPTDRVFKTYAGNFKAPVRMPGNLVMDEFTDFIKQQSNDLETPACAVVEDITNITNALRYAPGCKLARMSGSGATCFGIFDNAEQSVNAAEAIRRENPDWWIKTGIMGGSARY